MVPVGPVTAQSPEAGHRASKGSVVKLTFGHASTGSTAPATHTGYACDNTAVDAYVSRANAAAKNPSPWKFAPGSVRSTSPRTNCCR